MKYLIATICLLLFGTTAFAQKQAYIIYNNEGKQVSYEQMLVDLETQDIILFGELHNNPIAHWLELEVSKDLHQKKKLTLGAEMIESDNQEQLNAYLMDSITAQGLDTLARLWINHKTDYAPLVDFAKEMAIPFIATNIPRRYAKMVYKNGFGSLDTLSDLEKSWIAPLPIAFDPELATYKNILEMMGDHGSPELVMAQTIKDATMAHFILQHYVPDQVFLHFNGAYHSDYYEGILWYLRQLNNELRYASISTVSQADVNTLEQEHKGKADYIICVDEDMTSTY